MNPNYQEINAETERATQDSIWHFYQRLLVWRKQHPTLIYGNYEEYTKGDEQLFGYLRSDEKHRYFIIHNFTDEAQPFHFPEGNWSLELSNYDATSGDLKPWEGRVYRL